MKQPLSDKTQKRRKVLAVFSIVVVLAVFAGVTVLLWHYFKTIASSGDGFREYIRHFGWKAPLVFLGLQMLQVIVALLPGELLEIGAGLAFGAVEGTLLCLLGTLLSSAVIFSLVKRFGVKLIEIFFNPDKINQMKFLNSDKKVKRLTFWLFFIPGTPKDVLTYFAGLTRLRLSEFLIISTLARIPSVVSSTVGGHYLENGDYVTAAIVFAVTAAVSLLGLWLYSKRTAAPSDKPKE